ncbi:MAG: hypothetical protein ACI9HK_002575 [Pirellulaceae bacterium]|jgi:hypothetical protein
MLYRIILTMLAFSLCCGTSVTHAQPASQSWPHLTPAGFGLQVIGSGQPEHAPWNYKPQVVAGATSQLQVRFLPASRAGERIDVWVPQDDKSESPLPCIVIFYGGGWSGKVAGGLQKDIAELVARGYVVALPDYLLYANEPVPMAIWDGAHAIRWLREHAKTYRIDPARIGVWGFSAGGWLVQYLAPSDASTTFPVLVKDGRQKPDNFLVPMNESVATVAMADQPLRVQAIASDWGCERLAEKSMHVANAHWFGPDDPPLLTCHNVADQTPPGPLAYRTAGAIAEICYLDVKNTHVPNRATPAKSKSGEATTWHGRVFEFFDEYVKHPRRATSPEAVPAGGPIIGPVTVALRCVHATAIIYFTLDGSEPSVNSIRYTQPLTMQPLTMQPLTMQPLTMQPGETLRAIAVVPGLQASPIASFSFEKARRPAPVIVTRQSHFVAKVGQPFQADFAADGDGVTWHVCGRRGNVIDRNVNPSKLIPWLEIDSQTGRLSGTPSAPGTAVVLIVATIRDETHERSDARQIVVSVSNDVKTVTAEKL